MSPESIQLISSLGAGGACVIVVMLFLRHISADRIARNETTSQITACIDRNTGALEQNHQALGAAIHAIDQSQK